MRADSLGMFWEDLPPVKAPKAEKAKRTPPPQTWKDPNYLPGLQEAMDFKVDLMNDIEIYNCRGRILVFDIECYINYFVIGFYDLSTGKSTYAEMMAGYEDMFNHALVEYLCHHNTILGFNSYSYDIPVLTFALYGHTCQTLKMITTEIIEEEKNGYDLLRKHKLKRREFNHVDIMEVAPLYASLKTYSGRLHAQRMQDLPFAPETFLSSPQITITRYYLINDLRNTALLANSLLPQVNLRNEMTLEYGIDLRSKSDAQIAEAIIREEIEKQTGRRLQRPPLEIGRQYAYNIPSFLKFQSPAMNHIMHIVSRTVFTVSETGNIGMPLELADLRIHMGHGVYKLGIGGLHSTESKAAHVASDKVILSDRDVTSYYPFIIINQNLEPEHLRGQFLPVYKDIVYRRIAAKKAKDKSTAESLKIVINGSYGKLGSMWSVLYAPQLLVQVTMTGQLSLLMMIERLEMAGIPVVSANTDGIVIKCPTEKKELMEAIIARWELETGFQTEENRYLALYSRDVNNYIAVKADKDEDGNWLNTPPKEREEAFKTKGSYANPWRSGKYGETCLHKNPTATICVEALEELLHSGASIDETIEKCTDLRKFVTVRSVKGGAVKVWDEKNVEYLGKSVRWYYSKNAPGELVYAKSGNKVPKSDGAMPCMQLPDTMPTDIDYDWYKNETMRILKDIGYSV